MFTVPYQSDDPVIGSKVTVSYDPAAPSDAHDISRSPSTYDLPLGTFIFLTALGGLSMLGIGTAVVVYVRRRARARVLPQSSA
jgi:hypothetical protein